MNILITGKPRTGKTTLIKMIIKATSPACGGFYTEEIRRKGERIGFMIKTTDGKEAPLAEKGLHTPHFIGKYGVHIANLDNIGVSAVEEALGEKDFVIIDEIGKMELFSEKFRAVVMTALDSGKTVIGVISLVNWPFLNAIRARPDVVILEVDGRNNEIVYRQVNELLPKAGKT